MLARLALRAANTRYVRPLPIPASRSFAALPQPASSDELTNGGSKQQQPAGGSKAADRTAWSRLVGAVKGTVFGAMAATVPAKDREFFARRWGFVVPQSSAEAAQNTGPFTEQQLTVIEPAAESRDAIQQPPASTTAPAVIGDLIADLGYKQVVRCSLQELLPVKVWEKQRILRQDRCKRIAKAKLGSRTNNGDLVGLPGVITLFHNTESGAMGILDGQHRLGALMLLCEEGAWELRAPNIIADVFPVRQESEVRELFTEINSAEPVRLVDMPSEGMEDVLKAILSEAVEELAAEEPEMFKTSHRCRPPHVNKDNLRDEIYQNEFMTRHEIKTTAQLLAALKEVNSGLAKRTSSEWTEENCRMSPKLKTFASALEKAHANKFYLGMDAVWARK